MTFQFFVLPQTYLLFQLPQLLPCTINLTFICIVGVTYSMIGCMVLNQCSWRNINCALGKIRHRLIFVSVSSPRPFKQLVCLRGFHPPHNIWYIHSFCSTCMQIYCYFLFYSLKRKEIFKHSFEVLFLVYKEMHNQNKTLVNSILSTKVHFLFKTSFIK